jgi:hypothetical protein
VRQAGVERAQATADSETSTAAENVLGRIKQGLSWSIVPNKPAPDYSKELQIAQATLARLDSERASKDALVESLGRRIVATARRAVYEHGASIRTTYEATVASLRDMLVRLVALDRLAGVGHEERVMSISRHFPDLIRDSGSH